MRRAAVLLRRAGVCGALGGVTKFVENGKARPINCSITALRAPRGGAPFSAWSVVSIGDASHLRDGAAAAVANADVR